MPLSEPALRCSARCSAFGSGHRLRVSGAVRGTVLNDATLRHMLKAWAMAARHHARHARHLPTWASETTNSEDVIEAAWPTPKATGRGLPPRPLPRQAPPLDGRLGELICQGDAVPQRTVVAFHG